MANKATTTTMPAAAEVVLEADDGSDGKITINLSATAMPLSTSSPTGRCLKKSISTA